ncbi:hypothetical protein BLA28_05895 [Eisenbergiella tayi]|nr:hypothetical protein BLA28_05895 [Eisenbergiella tayi]
MFDTWKTSVFQVFPVFLCTLSGAVCYKLTKIFYFAKRSGQMKTHDLYFILPIKNSCLLTAVLLLHYHNSFRLRPQHFLFFRIPAMRQERSSLMNSHYLFYQAVAGV